MSGRGIERKVESECYETWPTLLEETVYGKVFSVGSAVCRREIELNFQELLVTVWENVHDAVAPTAVCSATRIVYVFIITIHLLKDISKTYSALLCNWLFKVIISDYIIANKYWNITRFKWKK